MISALASQNICTNRNFTINNITPVENFMIISVCTLVIFEVSLSESISIVTKLLWIAKNRNFKVTKSHSEVVGMQLFGILRSNAIFAIFDHKTCIK